MGTIWLPGKSDYFYPLRVTQSILGDPPSNPFRYSIKIQNLASNVHQCPRILPGRKAHPYPVSGLAHTLQDPLRYSKDSKTWRWGDC